MFRGKITLQLELPSLLFSTRLMLQLIHSFAFRKAFEDKLSRIIAAAFLSLFRVYAEFHYSQTSHSHILDDLASEAEDALLFEFGGA